MTRKEAIAFAGSDAWKSMTYAERAALQVHEEFLCMPFDVFHEAVENVLGRPVFTHELISKETLFAVEAATGTAPAKEHK